MKGTVIMTLFLTVFVFTSVFAQEDEKTVSGIRGGFQSARLVMDGSTPYDDASNLESFYIGFFNDNKIVPLLYFGKGLEYFQNGQKYSDGKRILHTISVPLYLKLKIGPVYGLGGIAGNIKVSEKYTVDNVINPTENDKSNWFDAPLFLGAGVKIFFVSVEARYHWGLLKVRDNGLHSQYLQLGAAISF